MAATDADGTAANNTVSYALASVVGDTAPFNIYALCLLDALPISNFEAPADAGADNTYDIVVTASDGLPAHDATRNVAITVTDVNDNAPVITSSTTASTADD